MYSRNLVVVKASLIDPTYHPLIFTGSQKVRNLASSSHQSTLSHPHLKMEQLYLNSKTNYQQQ